MNEVPMASFTSTIDEPGAFQVGDDLPDLRRHELTVRLNARRLAPGCLAGK
jgi:hypothetical protein